MRHIVCLWVAVVVCISAGAQQSRTPVSASGVLPTLVNFSGQLTDVDGKPLTGMVGVTFYLYAESQGGVPLWLETQNVQPDKTGRFTVALGSATATGLPTNLFASGEARWLGIQAQGQAEQARVMLLAVPYALKAADAETLGGLPSSAFVLAAPGAVNTNSVASSASSPQTTTPPVGGSGTQNYVPLWTDSTGDLGNSILYQLGTGASAKIGINEKAPLFTLDVNGQELVRGLFEMATTNYASPTKGYNSQPFNIESSAYNSGTAKYTLNHFQWQAEPTGNNTTSPGATLNLLYGTDPAAPSETGLKLSSTGLFTFASGQVFPGTGTITGVTAGTDLTGGGTSGTVTLNLDTTQVPQLNAANLFRGDQSVVGNVSVGKGYGFDIGGIPFVTGSLANANVFLGFAANATMTGNFNTASGSQALHYNVTGTSNVASGAYALYSNITGFNNTASGANALFGNATGSSNTANGVGALDLNFSGTDNTAVGATALFNNTASQNTALGSQALYSNTAGAANNASGFQALYSNTTGVANTASGFQALYSNTTGAENTASGFQALYSNTTSAAGGNTANGYQALYSSTTGQLNLAGGYQALYSNTSGSYNVADGDQALKSNTEGHENTAVGAAALYDNTTGYENTAVGDGALNNPQTGQDLTCIGFECTAGGDGLFNATAIGAHAIVGQSNSLVLGGTGEFAVKVGIGTTAPSNILTIARGAGHPVSDSWETYSSRRWKTNIQTLPDALAKVEQLRGVSYDLKDSGKHEIGVIAEEVGAVVPELVSWEANGKDASGVDYSRLTAVLIEAVKEQQAQIAKQGLKLATQSFELARAIEQIKSQQALARAQAVSIRALETKLTSYARQVQVKDRGLSNRPVVVASK